MLRQAPGTIDGVARTPTALERQLTAPPPPTALEAFRVARRRFLAGERLEMGALADDLGVNRVTLYRWVGNRERLLGEIIWSLAKPTLDQGTASVRDRGAARIVGIAAAFLQAVLAHDRFTSFVHAEPELALRLLTRRATVFQERLIAYYETLLTEEVEGGHLTTPIPLHDLAYTIVRILKSYVYTDLITGEEPDADRAVLVLRALLR